MRAGKTAFLVNSVILFVLGKVDVDGCVVSCQLLGSTCAHRICTAYESIYSINHCDERLNFPRNGSTRSEPSQMMG